MFESGAIRRFFEQIAELPDGCWMWTGATCSLGYGRFSVHGISNPAHRYSYQLLIGDVPPGLEMDHLCRMRECVNPFHVEPVTHAENMRRSSLAYKRDPESFRHHLWDRSHVRRPGNGVPLRTHCSRGHEFSAANTYILKGSRYCRACNCLRSRAARLKRKGA